jgi:hypothetical protein
MDNASLKRVVGRALANEGFERKSGDWYLRSQDLVVVINLQKDDFSDAWFVNLGVWISDLEQKDWPKSHVCHIQARVPRLWPGKVNEIGDLFDMEKEMGGNEERANAIAAFLKNELAPLCARLAQKESLLEIIHGERGTGLRVMLTARDWLGLGPPK